MLQRRTHWSSLYILSVLAVAGAVVVAVITWIMPYELLLDHALSLSGKPYLRERLQQHYFTPGKFKTLQYILPVLSLAGMLLVARRRQQLLSIHIIRPALQDIRDIFYIHFPSRQSIEYRIFWLISLFILLKAIYYVVVADISYDEAWSYNYYTAGPWYMTPFIYSNYPLYEWLTQAFKWLPFPTYINLRIPALLTGMGWLAAVYISASMTWNKRTALFCMAVAGTLPPVALYMQQAKGFLLVALFAVILFTALYHVLQRGWSSQNYRWTIIATMLGLGSSPIFLMPLAISGISFPLISLYVRKGKLAIPGIKAIAIGILAGVSLFYLPVITGTGLDPLLQSGVLHGVNPAHHTMWWHFKFISLWVTGWGYGWIYTLFVALGAVYLLKSKQYFLAITTVLSISTIILIPLSTGSYLYPRVWIFLVIPFAWVLTGLLHPYLQQSRVLLLLTIIVLTINTYSYAVYVERTWSNAWNRTTVRISQMLLQHDVKTYYTDFDYLLPITEYHYRLEGKQVKAIISNPGSRQYGDRLSLAGADAIVDAGDQNLEIPDIFHAVYRDSVATLYIRK